MKFWLLTAAAAVCFLKAASAECSNDPCTGTDYRSYSSCMSNKCTHTDCTESKCSSVDCNTCSSSSACCHSCCHSKCECSSFKCHTCSSSSSSACCQTCCQKQDCCTSKKQEECCKDKPVSPVIPGITLPNITIIINQSAPIVYNTLNQSCGGISTLRNRTHIVTTTGTCSHDPKPNQPCCIITHQPPCPQPLPIHHHCPPPVQNFACGPQCIIQPQVVMPPPPPPIIQPVIQPPPQIIQPVIQPPPPPPVMVQPQPISLCYLYPVHQCPQHCYGLCHIPGQSGCGPTQQWPFLRCGYGGSYFGGNGGFGGYGGFGGFGGYMGQGGYGGYGAGAQPIAG